MTYQPNWTSSPGGTLQEWLHENGMTQTELADKIGLSQSMVNRIIRDRSPLTVATALGLEKVTGIKAELWCALETNYQLALYRMQSPLRRGRIPPKLGNRR